MSFIYKRRIPYYFTDTSRIMHHSHFWKVFEEARTELFRSLGVPYSSIEKHGLLLVITEVSCRYFGNVGYDEEISVDVRIKQINKASLVIDYSMTHESDTLAIATTKLACVNTNKIPKRLPNQLYDALRSI